MENIDLLESPELLPNSVLAILEKYNDDHFYSECEIMKSELNQLGYDIDYGLSGEPFNLIKLEASTNYIANKERKINRILCGKTKRVIHYLPESEKELHNEFFALFLIEMHNELHNLNSK